MEKFEVKIIDHRRERIEAETPAKDNRREQSTSKSKTKRDQTVWHEAAKTEITVQKTDGWDCGFS